MHHEALNQNDSLSIEVSIEGGDARLDVLRIQLDCSMVAAQAANRNASKILSPFVFATLEQDKGQEFHNFV